MIERLITYKAVVDALVIEAFGPVPDDMFKTAVKNGFTKGMADRKRLPAELLGTLFYLRIYVEELSLIMLHSQICRRRAEERAERIF